MLERILFLLLIARLCTCFEIKASPTVAVGVSATATWKHEPFLGFTVQIDQINLVQDGHDEFSKTVLDDKKLLSQPSGLVTFTIPSPGTFRLEGVIVNKKVNNFADKFGVKARSDSIKADLSSAPPSASTSDPEPTVTQSVSSSASSLVLTSTLNPGPTSIENSSSSSTVGSQTTILTSLASSNRSEWSAPLTSASGAPSVTATTTPGTPPSADDHRLAKIIGSVLGVILFLLILAMLVYCRRRRREIRIIREEAGSSTSFQKDRMMISDRPWYQSPAYSFSRPWARSGRKRSDSSSTDASDSHTRMYSSSEISFSTITPSDSISQVGHPSKVYKYQIKRKPLRTSTDLSAVMESQGGRESTLTGGSTMVPGDEALDRPKPVFPNPIPNIITTSATPETSILIIKNGALRFGKLAADANATTVRSSSPNALFPLPTISFDVQDLLVTSFEITAPATITVGASAQGTWKHNGRDGVFQINLVKEDPIQFSRPVLAGKEMDESSGTVTFTVSNTGTYRLQAIKWNGLWPQQAGSSDKIKAMETNRSITLITFMTTTSDFPTSTIAFVEETSLTVTRYAAPRFTALSFAKRHSDVFIWDNDDYYWF
ncbi:hypothetical protein PQX77_014994 [Marasmius sp. AFHP31]|nr:hypothetical protein PQX77_014994 [Marasmius sp. AFHP31]